MNLGRMEDSGTWMKNSVDPDQPADLDLHCFVKSA